MGGRGAAVSVLSASASGFLGSSSRVSGYRRMQKLSGRQPASSDHLQLGVLEPATGLSDQESPGSIPEAYKRSRRCPSWVLSLPDANIALAYLTSVRVHRTISTK